MKRRDYARAGAGSVLASSTASAQVVSKFDGTTFLVAHGAWSAGWAWRKMHPLLSVAGNRLISPTYTGVGEREHLASPSNDLETHIQDILSVIKYEDLQNVILIGHSYGGMVATGVADRASERIAHLIYLDAFVPRNGEALIDLVPPQARQQMQERVKAGDGWRLAPNPTPADTSEADVKWIAERRLPQSFKCFEMPLRLSNAETTVPRSYIYCKRVSPGNTFGPFAERAKNEPGWRYYEIDASHSPHITAPERLAALLQRILVERT
jgi:pimeloyl-ACP methyl ester carboxylesterase